VLWFTVALATMHVLRLGITGGALLLCLALGRAPARRPFRRAGSLLFAVVVAAAVGQVVTLRTGAPYGYANRVFATAMVAWLLATAMQLRRVTASPRDLSRRSPAKTGTLFEYIPVALLSNRFGAG
jgi:hypothetical protein